MHELRRAMFGRLLRLAGLPDCEDCGGAGLLDCEHPIGLLESGELTEAADDPDVVVAWPGCPNKWRVLREWGQDLIPLSECCAWAYETDAHKDRDLPARQQSLLREWLALRHVPVELEKVVRAERARRGA